ncbi:MAG: ATP-binding cassette domain-containing protein [Pseudonocardiales bacterium]|nr:ATP-binding cassette domain-containing protein [Pseudonocardiales bacterium]
MDDGWVTVEGLSKRFGAVVAVEDLTFTVAPGTVCGFLGPNGSGKTTTLRMLLGLVRPTAGRAWIGRARYADLPFPARVVGAVLEAQGFHPGRTARAHLLACAAAVRVPDVAVDHALGAVGLASAAGRRVGTYSLGMRQRLALATALLGDPAVLVLDEPGNGLDPEGIAWLREFLRGFAAEGRTVLVASHVLAEIEQTVDDVVVVSRGRCVHRGPLAGLRGRPRVLVTCPDPGRLAGAIERTGAGRVEALADGRLAVTGAEAARVGDIALAAGVAVHGLRTERPDLEQAFLRLTGAGR